MRLVLLPLFLGAACAQTPPAANFGTCGAAELQTMVGQSADVLATMRFRTPMRVIGPDMAVTMDHNP